MGANLGGWSARTATKRPWPRITQSCFGSPACSGLRPKIDPARFSNNKNQRRSPRRRWLLDGRIPAGSAGLITEANPGLRWITDLRSAAQLGPPLAAGTAAFRGTVPAAAAPETLEAEVRRKSVGAGPSAKAVDPDPTIFDAR